MTPVRISAVSYLNSMPLVDGLPQRTDLFSVRLDIPSTCAALLHAGDVDLGLIPSIEYLARPDYHIVPGIAVVSRGPVASVCLFSRRPVEQVRSIALDATSRTSVALLRVLCARRFGITPAFVTLAPDVDRMLQQCDAALLIGDLALDARSERTDLTVADLGEHWTAWTGLPFVWAFWAGRPGVLDAHGVQAIQAARDAGVAAIDRIAREFGNGDARVEQRASRYLRQNIRFWLGEDEREALTRYYAMAADEGIVAGVQPLRFYPAG